MSTQSLAKQTERMPIGFDDFFKPWNEWFDDTNLVGRTMNMPAVNITEQKDEYMVSLAVPGMKKDDFKIDVDGNMLTISSKTFVNLYSQFTGWCKYQCLYVLWPSLRIFLLML